MPVYCFDQDSEKVKWLKTADRAHGRAQLEHWRSKKAKQIGEKAAQAWMLDLIKQAKRG